MLDKNEKNILATVAYYDGMDYPLTGFEIWKHQINFENEIDFEKVSLSETVFLLEKENIQRLTEEFQGFYFLKGRKKLVESRIKRNKIAFEKFRKLRKTAWLLRFVPFVRMVAVTGRMAMKNTEGKSDWDLLVIVKQGRIWTGRTALTAFLHLLGKRRHGEKIKDRFCLNCFIADESLKIKIENRDFEFNLFSANEYSFILPIFNFKKFKKFQIKNAWIKELKVNFYLNEIRNMKMVSDSHFSKTIRKAGEKILGFDFIEKFLRKIELRKIENNIKTKKKEGIIEATDDALVFLPKPQGKEIYEKSREKLSHMGIF